MNCTTCGKPLVGHYGTSTTLVGYYSPPGHNHDDNCANRQYYCEDGHSTGVSLRRSCPACDWKGKIECFCHAGTKVDRWPKIGRASAPTVMVQK